MTTQHTPGPWRVQQVGTPGYFVVRALCRGPLPMTEANARLMAAAPDLLALAHKYADECSECGGTATVWTHPPDPQDAKDLPCPACKDIWEVIERAEGTQPANATRARAMQAGPRWACPECRGTNVQISLPAWHTETADLELKYVETDDGAEALWWWCEDCQDSQGGQPIDLTAPVVGDQP